MFMYVVDTQEVTIQWFIYCKAVLCLLLFASSPVFREKVNYRGLCCVFKIKIKMHWINLFLSIVEGNWDRFSSFSVQFTLVVHSGLSLQFSEECRFVTFISWFILLFFFSPFNKLQEETNHFNLIKIKLTILTDKG